MSARRRRPWLALAHGDGCGPAAPESGPPRGANRDAVLRVVGERPGITTSELAAASGVAKPTLYALLSSLTKQGVLQRQQLPGGQSGYRVRAVDASATGRPEGVRESTEP